MNRIRLYAIVLSLSAVAFSWTWARAGTGQIVDGKLNLSVRFNYREADPDSWRPMFEEASRLLYNATDGQLQLGRIRVADCGTGKSDADIWIQTGLSGAFATLLGLDAPGHIYLSQVHKSSSGFALGQFGLVHELGHYLFGLYDEYKGAPPPGFAFKGLEQVTLNDPYRFCTTDEDSVACIMDGGTTILPNHFRTEFCTHAHEGLSTAHNAGLEIDGVVYENAQQALNGESCWETMARQAGLVPPAQVITEDPPGLEPIVWEVVPAAQRFVLCVDRSASMVLRPENLSLAKEVSNLLVGFLHGRKTVTLDGVEVTLPGEDLAIVEFAREAPVSFPFREIVGEGTKDSARDAIEAIAGEVAGSTLVTDLAAGLRTSLGLLEVEGATPACSEAILLLSDGAEDSWSDPLEVLPELRERGVRVYTVGLGKDGDFQAVRALADSTDGRFFRAVSSEELEEIAQLVAVEMRSAGVLGSVEDSTSGQDEHQTVLIDSFAEEVTFVLQWNQGTLDMVLTSPSGDIIDFDSADQREDIEASRSDNLLYLRVVHPEQGLWDALVHPVEVPGTIDYSIHALDENRTVSVQATADRAANGVFTPIRLRVDVIADVPVAGAQVVAAVTPPAGEPQTIPLFDDGEPIHGDQWANDGVYHALYTDLPVNGTYAFHVTVTCVNGTGPDPNLPFVEEGPGPPETIPPFVRETDVTIVVEDVWQPIQGSLEAHPTTLNVQNSNGVVTCYVELPSPHDAAEIDLESVRLNGVPRKASSPSSIGDHDGDGVPDRMVKFERGAVIETLPDGVSGALLLTGVLQGDLPWRAADVVAIVNSGAEGTVTVLPPALEAGATATLLWSPLELDPVSYSGYVSRDGGLTWEMLFHDLTASSYEWQSAGPEGTDVVVLVQADSPEGVLRQDTSMPFDIQAPSSVPPPALARIAFLGAQPNPAAGRTTLRYSLSAAAEVRLAIYDVAGRLVRTLASGQQAAGVHAKVWDGTDDAGHAVTAGVYLYRFAAGSYRKSGTMMLVK